MSNDLFTKSYQDSHRVKRIPLVKKRLPGPIKKVARYPKNSRSSKSLSAAPKAARRSIAIDDLRDALSTEFLM